MTSNAATVEEYLAELTEDRRVAAEKMRAAILANLGEGYEEGIQYGHIGYYVPHSIYPSGYHCDPKQPVPFVGIGNQKGHLGFYGFCLYVDEGLKAWFIEEHEKRGYKLDMGAGCVRYKKMDQIPFDLIGEVVARVPLEKFLAYYEQSIPESKKKKK